MTSKSRLDADQDYRIPFSFENLKLPPPPPPPSRQTVTSKQKKMHSSPGKGQDNIEDIDMDLSDDADDRTEPGNNNNNKETVNDNLTVVKLVDNVNDLEPPPPFPEFTDDTECDTVDFNDVSNNTSENDEGIVMKLESDTCMENGMNPPAPEPEPEPDNNDSDWNNVNVSAPDGHFQNMPFQIMGPPFQMPRPLGNWMPPPFNHVFMYDGRNNNKRGNFINRGDFRGRPRFPPPRGGRFFRGNIRPFGNMRSRPSFRGRPRGGY